MSFCFEINFTMFLKDILILQHQYVQFSRLVKVNKRGDSSVMHGFYMHEVQSVLVVVDS